jgi:hypothetical protein
MRIIGLSLAFVMALCAAKADAQDPGAPPTPAPIAPLDRTVTLEVQNSPLVRVIESINEQAGLGLAYSDQILPKEKLVTLTVRNITARQASPYSGRRVHLAIQRESDCGAQAARC